MELLTSKKLVLIYSFGGNNMKRQEIKKKLLIYLEDTQLFLISQISGGGYPPPPSQWFIFLTFFPFLLGSSAPFSGSNTKTYTFFVVCSFRQEYSLLACKIRTKYPSPKFDLYKDVDIFLDVLPTMRSLVTEGVIKRSTFTIKGDTGGKKKERKEC